MNQDLPPASPPVLSEGSDSGTRRDGSSSTPPSDEHHEVLFSFRKRSPAESPKADELNLNDSARSSPFFPKTISDLQFKPDRILYGREYAPLTKRASKLPHSLQDYINTLPEWQQLNPHLRYVFESSIVSNTAHDEPNAPEIQVINNIDGEAAPPWEFHYSNLMWHGKGVPSPDMKNLVGCDCIGPCDPRNKNCACVQRQERFSKLNKHVKKPPMGFLYDANGRLRELQYPIFECNDLCQCSEECRNRVSGGWSSYSDDVLSSSYIPRLFSMDVK